MALGAGAAVVILGVAVVLEPLVRPGVTAPPADPGALAVPDFAPETTAPETIAPDVIVPDKMADPQEVVVMDAIPDPVPAPDPVPTMAAPVIDVVRIAPNGSGIVAGRALAGTAVSVMLDDTLVAEAMADASGSFAAFVTLPLSDRPRTLSLIADPAGAAVGSEATVIVAPSPVPELPQTDPEVIAPDVVALAQEDSDLPETVPEAVLEAVREIAPELLAESDSLAAVEPAGVAPDTASPGLADTQQAAPAEPTVLAEAASPDIDPTLLPSPAQTQISTQTVASITEPSPAVLPEPAPALTDTVAALQPPAPETPGIAPVLRLDEAGVRILQPAIAPGATPEVLATVALDAIAYDAAGDVQLSGRAAGGGTVRIYVDNRVIIEVPVAADGLWASALPDVPTGVYTMRVDQLDTSGAVVSRIETPFLREERETIAAAMVDQTAAPDFTVAVKTVQPGATLWAIARERYGDGVLYVQVFEANRDRIRNPDLIYPGQVFVLPELPQQ